MSSAFFRVLNAPFASRPLLPAECPPTIPRINNPIGTVPLSLPIYTSTGRWEWLNNFPFYDIHDTTTISRDRLQNTTIRMCRASDRTVTVINKSWRADSRSPGIVRELWLYKFPLRDLAGVCALNLIAVRAGPGKFNLTFELPHQSFFLEPSADMPEVLKRRVVKALQKLHAKGICHNAISQRNILIGGDGNVYFYNFNRARYRTAVAPVHLDKAKDIDFESETRRLKFQLNYQDAREKEKDRLAKAILTTRRNDSELRKQKLDSSYEPKLTTPDPAPFSLPKFESWVQDLDSEPRRYIMPGQTEEDFEWELKRFYNILRRMEELDAAAGLVTLPTAVETLVKAESPPAEDVLMTEVEKTDDNSVMVLDGQPRLLKRKRSSETTDSASSKPPLIKRPRRGSQPNSDLSSRRFKNDELRPGIKLVSSYKIHPSVQENNVVSEWPIIVVRDFQKQPRPELGAAMEALVKKNHDRFKKEQALARAESERANREEEKDIGPSWLSLWNPLRYLFGSDKGREEKAESLVIMPTPRKHNTLRRHETLVDIC